ncbi:sensor histidine kinase [Patescibacteria group bacterium]
MDFKKIFMSLNIIAQCKKYGFTVWQCPQFLFLIMGLLIIGASLGTYAIGNKYIEDPQIVSLIVIVLAVILVIIAFIITQNFEHLAEANRLKSEFVSIVSHQLRSPLTNLRWAIDFLLSGDVGDKKTDYFEILKENAHRMSALIDDLLIVSRLEQSRLPMKKTEISLENLVKEVIDDSNIFAEASHIKIDFQSEENLPKIFIDSSQIKLTIENLLNNAIRYTKDKGRVSIKMSKKNKVLKIEIKDNGVGVPEQDKKFLFQKFFRAQNVLRYQTQGSGLGLYIAKAIVNNAKGKIGFVSEEGKGSTFWFTLPITNNNKK